MPTILIAGGYGAVGSKIARQLSGDAANTVIIAGRNLAKAQQAASASGGMARNLDLTNPDTWAAALDGVDLVIVCIDQSETGFLEMVTARGIAYIDVTAGDEFFRKAEALTTTCTVLLSVGLAPGLSNLLTVEAASDMEQIDSIEIGLLMGTGDEHGSAAIAWSTAQMFDPNAKRDDAIVDFGPDFGRRRAYFMDFADQHVLNRTLNGVKTITRVTYDSALLTSALFWLGRSFSGNRHMENLVNRISHMPTFGSDKCVLTVTAKGRIAGQPVERTVHFFGQKEAAVTAAMAVAIAENVLNGRITTGIHHAHEVVAAKAIFARMEKWGHGRFAIGPIVSSVQP
jgi:saccharopine dehydrogenase (NAD+, L-lysine-forming)